MYIDTRNQTTMLFSVSKFFGLSAFEFKSALDTLIQDDNEKTIEKFLKEHKPAHTLDQMLFFHLSRKLNTNTDNSLYNLRDLLTLTTPVSQFLSQYGITFGTARNKIIPYLDGTQLSLSKIQSGYVAHIKTRLGWYSSPRSDFAVNGFAFADSIKHNSYYNQLGQCPEFIRELSEVLGNDQICHDYASQSSYYLLTYCVPSEIVLFDAHQRYLSKRKIQEFLKIVLKKLIQYNTFPYQISDDSDNIALRLSDNANLDEKYLLFKTKIR